MLSFDMGGTTAKLCLVDDGNPVLSRMFEVARGHRDRRGSGLPLRIPVVEMVEIGAGGGSIARRDALGRVRVGPESAGSEPGPACYGRGGLRPTVSDADLLMGRLHPVGLAGGRVRLSPEWAAAAMAPIGPDPLAAAHAIGEVVDEAMAAAARQHAAERGASTEGRTMIAFGGAAPLHAARLAEKLGVHQVLIPGHAGVGSAVGFLRAPIAFSMSRSLPQRLSNLNLAAINAALAAMLTEAEAAVRAGAPEAALRTTRECFARYVGQAHEIAVELPDRPLTQADAVALQAGFDASYAGQYGRLIPGMAVEVLTWSLRIGTVPLDEARLPCTTGGREQHLPRRRQVFDPGQARRLSFTELRRAEMEDGDRLTGPAVLTEDETTIVVPPGWVATAEPEGATMLQRAAP